MRLSNYCPICQQNVDLSSSQVIVTCCGHTYHTNCLRRALKYDQRCPLCRTRLGQEFPIKGLIFLRCRNPETGYTWTIGVNNNGTTRCSFPYWINSCRKINAT